MASSALLQKIKSTSFGTSGRFAPLCKRAHAFYTPAVSDFEAGRGQPFKRTFRFDYAPQRRKQGPAPADYAHLDKQTNRLNSFTSCHGRTISFGESRNKVKPVFIDRKL